MFNVTVDLDSAHPQQVNVVVKLRWLPSGHISLRDEQRQISGSVEVNFYKRGLAAQCCVAGAECPKPLLLEGTTEPGALHLICLSRLEGVRQNNGLQDVHVVAAIEWLARLHAF